MAIKTYSYFLVCGILLLCSACARTVTEREVPLFLEIKLTTRGAINTIENNYLIIFSHTNTPIALPPVSPGSHVYFPTPGRQFTTDDPTFSEAFDTSGITPYYQTYFNTWSDYFIIHFGTSLLYNSGAAHFDEATNDNNRYTYNRNRFSPSLTIIGNTITFTFDVSVITPSLSGIEYLSLATTKITDGSETGFFMDKTGLTAEIPIKAQQKVGPNREFENLGLDASTDIILWEARLF